MSDNYHLKFKSPSMGADKPFERAEIWNDKEVPENARNVQIEDVVVDDKTDETLVQVSYTYDQHYTFRDGSTAVHPRKKKNTVHISDKARDVQLVKGSTEKYRNKLKKVS